SASCQEYGLRRTSPGASITAPQHFAPSPALHLNRYVWNTGWLERISIPTWPSLRLSPPDSMESSRISKPDLRLRATPTKPRRVPQDNDISFSGALANVASPRPRLRRPAADPARHA